MHDIVNEKNEVIGTAERIKFLKNKNLIRRSCHIWLKNSKGKFLFQQRSKSKDLQPLHWSCTAAGFIGAGNNSKVEILKEAKRELKEELGIKVNIKLFKIYLHKSQTVGGIMVYLFFGRHNGPIRFNPKELADVKAYNPIYFYRLYKK